ncbi:uncharacterized protein E0L32_010010 [Thyridium curvatum]|uniref:Uncharacterized protein n=1 Tax=Thyridium curvatum TaxID=1093900 RepID=A0A507ALQ7_9PEZI|nr:uncharacterized protein E0L32_010010 [Thyridium curvatum]TPX08523.1 hypothetical protein E0L32_010010 [Thyridium curvatum]
MAIAKLSAGKRQWHPLPTYHLKAPHGWLNDPCAPGFDPATGTYHLFYQWNPKSCDWEDICWGQFTSKDGLHWEANSTGPVLEPSKSYDDKGIFTGCMHPTGPRGEKCQLTLIYSSITNLPIHWTVPYQRNCAGLAIAISENAGRTWKKSPLNPILKGEPEGLRATGFRDPYLAEWGALDEKRGATEKQLYGFVSGGIVDKGPNVFVYAVSPHDLTRWTYIGPLVDIPVGFTRPGHWTGDFGVNWECVNFLGLDSGADTCPVLLMGTEGGYQRGYKEGGEVANETWTLWMAGSLQTTQQGPALDYEFGGILDHGSLYAPNSYRHPDSRAWIVWGWIKEEELTLSRREAKGWTGYLSLPREVFMQRLHNVRRALKTPLEAIPSIRLLTERPEAGTRGVETLGIRPLLDLKRLRQGKPSIWLGVEALNQPYQIATPASPNWELEAFIKIHPAHERIGFQVRHNEDRSNMTSIYFSPQDEEIVVDKTLSNDLKDIQKGRIGGSFTLFVQEKDGAECLESLHLRIFSDGDVIEVFANDRFALSTTVYSDAINCLGISCFAEGQDSSASGFETVMLWEGLASVYAK